MSEPNYTPSLALNQGSNAPVEMGQDDLEAVRRLRDAFDNIKKQLSRIIVGQDEVIEELLIALFSKGHCILEGVPGLAKTLMISTCRSPARPAHPGDPAAAPWRGPDVSPP